jgi:hypothetical protein
MRFARWGVTIFCVGVLWCGVALAQGTGASDEAVVGVVRGKVVNAVTGVPVGRALVVEGGNQAAIFTDDRGEFALKISDSKAVVVNAPIGVKGRRRLEVRKPGFLGLSRSIPYAWGGGEDAEDVTIALVPEALIVGRVEVPGSDGEVQIECELYQKEFHYGQETWAPATTFRTWANGEFRFSGLKAGTYKLITHEQMDRDSMRPVPGAPMFGYPPIYYPNTTDFSAASAIVVRAGETAQVNLTVARREYFPVQIGVRNAPAGRPMNVQVAPMGTHSPGWSLGYNPMDGTIMGMLPDGNYTVEATALGGQDQSTGILNFTVRGRPLEGPALTLVPDASVTVNVHEEFSGQSDAGALNAITTSAMGPAMHIQVSLMSVKEVSRGGGGFARPVEGADGHTLAIANVVPGQYRVRVMTGRGYVASMESDGVDLLRQPLVVGLGGAPAPIEIVLRDDGGEVDVSFEQATEARGSSGKNGESSQNGLAYLLPMEQSADPTNIQGHGTQNGSVAIEQVAPGDYLVVVFDTPPESLLMGGDMEALQKKGKVIHVEAGQKVSVQVKMNSEGGE